MSKQHTISKPVSLKGVGIHTGKEVNLTFKPAEENFGYAFCRTDLPEKPIIEANINYVVNTDRGTNLDKNGIKIKTSEHVLAALVGMEIDNILIELDASEPPIMDGSSKYFVEALQKWRASQFWRTHRPSGSERAGCRVCDLFGCGGLGQCSRWAGALFGAALPHR